MTYREAKTYMLCTCYTLQELEKKRGALLAGEAPKVPSRLLDTGTLDEVEEAIREHDSERFRKERETLPGKHLELVAGHVAQDLDLEYYDNDDAKGLERGIRSLCVRERKEDLQKRLDDIRAGRPEDGPWHIASDATTEELECALALYDDALYEHLRELSDRVRLDGLCVSHTRGELRARKNDLLAWPDRRPTGEEDEALYVLMERIRFYSSIGARNGDDSFLVPSDPLADASVELLDRALAEYGKSRYERARKLLASWDGPWPARRMYLITDGRDVGQLVAGPAGPHELALLAGTASLEASCSRQAARMLAEDYGFDILAEDELGENVAFVRPMLSDLAPDGTHGEDCGVFRVRLPDFREYYSDDGNRVALVRSAGRRNCPKVLYFRRKYE